MKLEYNEMTLETYDFKKMIKWFLKNLPNKVNNEDICSFEFNATQLDDGWMYDALVWTTKGTFIVGTASEGFFKDMINVPIFNWERNVLMFDIYDIRRLIND